MPLKLKPFPSPGDVLCGSDKQKWRKPSPRNRNTRIMCEKPALHAFGCVLTDEQIASAKGDRVLLRLLRAEAESHCGRDRSGHWWTWRDGDVR